MSSRPLLSTPFAAFLFYAQEYGTGPVTLETVCSRRKLPKQYLTKLFSHLAKSGLVNPIRGKGGGYTLGRSPEEITLLQVIEAIEGPIVLNLCQHHPPQCLEDLCAIRPVWSELQKIVREKLASLNLALCVPQQKHAAAAR